MTYEEAVQKAIAYAELAESLVPENGSRPHRVSSEWSQSYSLLSSAYSALALHLEV